jgi:hypothetical protein
MANAKDKKETHISVTGPALSGYFAVMYWWNPSGFWEPWETGIGRYPTKEEAIVEGKAWAESEGLEFLD